MVSTAVFRVVYSVWCEVIGRKTISQAVVHKRFPESLLKLIIGYISALLGEVKPRPRADVAENSLAEKEKCSVCHGAHKNLIVLPKCGHTFSKDCIDKAFKTKKVCPLCSAQLGLVRGNQPVGYMTWAAESDSLPGHEDCGTIVASYSIPDGTQGTVC